MPEADATTGPVLLSGGNPQIPKGDGDAPVQAYVDAVPGWKQGIVRQIDALVVELVPDVRKAVRWNSPFWGVEGKGWFLGLHCTTKYVKVSFFKGSELDPVPPESSKDPSVRYAHVTERAGLDVERMSAWITQAAALPGWAGF